MTLLIKYYGFIPVLVMILGILNYYIVISFINIARGFIRAGVRSGGGELKEAEPEHIVQKYCSLVLLVGVFLVELGIINPMIASVEVFNYPIWIHCLIQYIGLALIGILDMLFSYWYIFKGDTWGRCIGNHPKLIIVLFSLWGFSFIVSILLMFYVK